MKKLNEQILNLGPAIPGTIRQVLLRCGRKNCACASGHQRDKHGPYFFWSHKNNGRLTSLSLTESEARQFQQWIDNRRTLEGLVQDILDEGIKMALETRKPAKSVPQRKRVKGKT